MKRNKRAEKLAEKWRWRVWRDRFFAKTPQQIMDDYDGKTKEASNA